MVCHRSATSCSFLAASPFPEGILSCSSRTGKVSRGEESGLTLESNHYNMGTDNITKYISIL